MTKLCLFTGWLSSLVPVKETLNSPAYQDILDKFMIPTLWEQLGEDPFLFQYDCVPVMDEQVWCGKIWPAGTESWPQSDRMLLGWIRVETDTLVNFVESLPIRVEAVIATVHICVKWIRGHLGHVYMSRCIHCSFTSYFSHRIF